MSVNVKSEGESILSQCYWHVTFRHCPTGSCYFPCLACSPSSHRYRCIIWSPSSCTCLICHCCSMAVCRSPTLDPASWCFLWVLQALCPALVCFLSMRMFNQNLWSQRREAREARAKCRRRSSRRRRDAVEAFLFLLPYHNLL